MQFKRTIPKILIASILSSIVTLVATLIANLVFTVPSPALTYFMAILLSLVSFISFSVFLVYLLHVYHANGEGDVWEDYPEVYGGVFKDIPRVIKKERYTLIFIILISITTFILHMVSLHLFYHVIIEIAVLLFKPTSVLLSVPAESFFGQALEYILACFANCSFYVITLALFRWKWRRFM
jgi:hypothetical protein